MDDEQQPVELSRSRRRDEAVAYTALAEALTRSKRGELPNPPFDEETLAALLEARRLTKNARSRQVRRLAGLLRSSGTMSELNDALEGRAASVQNKQAEEQENEVWRTRLLAEGDVCLGQFIAAYPRSDRTRMRQLVRQTNKTPEGARSKRAGTSLLRLIREIRAGGPAVAVEVAGTVETDDTRPVDAEESGALVEKDAAGAEAPPSETAIAAESDLKP